MTKQQSIRAKWVSLALFVGITLLLGAATALLISGSLDVYQTIEKPAFAPPAWVFPVVWTALYILMAVSAWLVWHKNRPDRRTAMTLYALQLFVNLVWPLIFFVRQAFGLAFVWLVLLWMLVLLMMGVFHRASRTAFWMNAPYILWITFAGILNFAIARMNP